MSFLFFIFALFPIDNAPAPCAQEPVVLDVKKEQDRLIRIELKKKIPVIISVNPETDPKNIFLPQINGNPVIEMPEGWTLVHLSNINFDNQNYLVAQIQRANDNRVLRIMLPMVLTISSVGDNINRIREKRMDIAKYIAIGAKEYKEKEKEREIKLAEYVKSREGEEAKAKKQQAEKDKQEKILLLRKRIFSRDYFDQIRKETSCYTTYSVEEVTDKKGVVIWEIWNCPIEEGSVRFFAVPTNQSKSVIEVKPQIEDGHPNKADLLNQIKEVRRANLL